jgi:hypothetical protein
MMAISDNVLRKEPKPHSFNFTFHYVDDVFSLNKSKFGDYASYLNLNLEIDSGIWLITKLFDKI